MIAGVGFTAEDSKMKYLIMCAALLLLSHVAIAQQENVPGFPVPFQAVKGRVQDPVLRVGSFFKDGKNWPQPSFWIGNKRIGVREVNGVFRADEDHGIGLVVDNREIFRFTFWGSYEGGGFGYPFQLKPGTQPELKVDEVARTVTYSKQYLLPNGEPAIFSYTLKGLPDSKVELSWDLGITQAGLDELPKAFNGVALCFTGSKDSRNASILINQQQFKPADEKTLSNKETGVLYGEEGLDFQFSPDKPLEGFSFKLSGNHTFIASESRQNNVDSIVFRTGSKQRVAHDSMVIDFGIAAEKSIDAPAPVAGVDFWARDVMDVPAPTTRNLIPNPSFEQGLRYWRWFGGGGTYVESKIPNYSTSNDAKFGKQALLIQPTQGNQPMQSLPIPVLKGHTYTVSFYGKAVTPDSSVSLGVTSAVNGSEFNWQKALSKSYKLTESWTRTSFTFISDTSAICLMMGGGRSVLIDGIQVEEGASATEFVAPAVEGNLLTADPDNFLAAGAPINASFKLVGAAGLTGEVEFTLFNYYRERVYHANNAFVLDQQGSATLPLPFDPAILGTGIFVLKANYRLKDATTLREYYRLSVMDFLENKHATKDLFGNLSNAVTLTRADDNLRNYMRWGFGSTTYGGSQQRADLFAKYRIANHLSIAVDLCSEEQRKLIDSITPWTEIPPGGEKMIEDLAFDIAKARPWGDAWALETETEGRCKLILNGNFAEWFKVQMAFRRGIKRANPNATVLPDGGTSGFGRLRGYREMGEYLRAGEGKVKWDAIAVHPYGTLDGIKGWDDFDVNIPLLQNLMKKYGYGSDTPIDYTEGFNVTDTNIPEWGDDGCYDNYQADKPTYDFGWKEHLQAAWIARTYIMCMEHWPQVRSFNIWTSTPYLDQYFAPLALCKIPNTLGHLFPNPKFRTAVSPASGVRGYVFEDEEGRGVAAIWCAIDKVEEGLESGPDMSVRFGEHVPQFIDLMGNVRKVKIDNGRVNIPLGPAPLFLRSDKGGAAQLADTLNRAEISGSSRLMRVAVQPTVSGGLEASLSNLTSHPLKGSFIAGKDQTAFEVDANGSAVKPLTPKFDPIPGKIYSWKESFGLQFTNGRTAKVDWDMSFFYVPHAAKPLPSDPASSDWKQIPAIPMTNWVVQKNAADKPGNLKAAFQLAWDKDNLYLRVSAADHPLLLPDPSRFVKDTSHDPHLHINDGCLETYFDTGANGRTNQFKGYDPDDYRYDAYAGDAKASNGPGLVYRSREPYHQLAGGLEMPGKSDAAQGVKCQFSKTETTYAYVMVFPRKYLEPMKLEAGWQTGFGLYLHNKDVAKRDAPDQGLSLATEPGAPCDARPDLWPIMIFAKENQTVP